VQDWLVSIRHQVYPLADVGVAETRPVVSAGSTTITPLPLLAPERMLSASVTRAVSPFANFPLG
jgi:hypothetical protein